MTPSDERLQKGIAAYKQGRKEAAGQLFKQALELNPRNEKAWLWLSGVVDSDEQRLDCLRRVLAINPENLVARHGLRKITAEKPPEKKPPSTPKPPPSSPSTIDTAELPLPKIEPVPIVPEPPKNRSRRWIFLGLGILLITLGAFASIFILSPYHFINTPLSSIIFDPSNDYSPEEEFAVISTIYENIAAANSENIDRYMASLHTQSPRYDTTRETLEMMYREYDLTVSISRVEIIHYTAEEALVRFQQETRKRTGPDFPDNRIQGIFILRPEKGEWKLYDQVMLKREYLD